MLKVLGSRPRQVSDRQPMDFANLSREFRESLALLWLAGDLWPRPETAEEVEAPAVLCVPALPIQRRRLRRRLAELLALGSGLQAPKSLRTCKAGARRACKKAALLLSIK